MITLAKAQDLYARMRREGSEILYIYASIVNILKQKDPAKGFVQTYQQLTKEGKTAEAMMFYACIDDPVGNIIHK